MEDAGLPVSLGRVPNGRGYLSTGAPRGPLESWVSIDPLPKHSRNCRESTNLFGLAKPVSKEQESLQSLRWNPHHKRLPLHREGFWTCAQLVLCTGLWDRDATLGLDVDKGKHSLLHQSEPMDHIHCKYQIPILYISNVSYALGGSP